MSAGLYRLRAQDCIDKAELASDPVERANWISLGEKWRRLATEVEMRQMALWGVCEGSNELTLSRVQHMATGAIRHH